MQLSSIVLHQFRNYAKVSFRFSFDSNIIVAPNAAGKTNILEAIYLLATGKSFRADKDSEMIRWGGEMARIKSQISNLPAGKVGLNDQAQTELEIIMTTGEVGGEKAPLKKYLVNGIPRRQVDFVGNLRAVLFWPEHLGLVTDSPSLRRRYLDSVLVQVDREYRRNLLSYERGLRQRNKLLDLIGEGKASRGQLLFWNQLLTKAGAYITDKRAEYIDFVNHQEIRDNGKEISKSTDLSLISYPFSLIYDNSVISEARLEQYKDEEVAAGATLVGPHRDDIHFVIRDTKYVISKTDEKKNISHLASHVSLSSFGSRGQQRLAILWLKLAELEYIHEVTGDRPILLLDDIFSELDHEHRKLVFSVVGKQQTIITSADPLDLPETLEKNASVIRL